MPIDECPYTFVELATRVLPDRMKQMRSSMQIPWKMSDFSQAGVGTKSHVLKLGRKADFKGCYVFLESSTPVYVGISQCVIQQLQQHVKGKTHYDASLAYRMAADGKISYPTRSSAMEDPVFRSGFEKNQTYIQSLYVACVEIDNPLELYLFEAFCSMELDTHQWNTFATH
jgi:hypothetical protein